MDREQFVNDVFKFYNKSDEDGLKTTYNLAFSYPKKIDWENLYMYVIKNCESTYLPKPKYFIDLFPNFIINNFINGELLGKKVRVEYKSGRVTEFVICNCETKLSDLINRFKNMDAIVKAEMYDKDVTFIGKQIHPKDAIGKLLYQGG